MQFGFISVEVKNGNSGSISLNRNGKTWQKEESEVPW